MCCDGCGVVVGDPAHRPIESTFGQPIGSSRPERSKGPPAPRARADIEPGVPGRTGWRDKSHRQLILVKSLVSEECHTGDLVVTQCRKAGHSLPHPVMHSRQWQFERRGIFRNSRGVQFANDKAALQVGHSTARYRDQHIAVERHPRDQRGGPAGGIGRKAGWAEFPQSR